MCWTRKKTSKLVQEAFSEKSMSWKPCKYRMKLIATFKMSYEHFMKLENRGTHIHGVSTVTLMPIAQYSHACNGYSMCTHTVVYRSSMFAYATKMRIMSHSCYSISHTWAQKILDINAILVCGRLLLCRTVHLYSHALMRQKRCCEAKISLNRQI